MKSSPLEKVALVAGMMVLGTLGLWVLSIMHPWT